MRPEAEMSLPLVFAANLLWGYAFAYIFSNWKGDVNFTTGAIHGAIISILIGLSFDLFMHAFTTMNSSLIVAVYNGVGNAVVGALGGGIICWWLGRK
jgi:hypothetical protein